MTHTIDTAGDRCDDAPLGKGVMCSIVAATLGTYLPMLDGIWSEELVGRVGIVTLPAVVSGRERTFMFLCARGAESAVLSVEIHLTCSCPPSCDGE